MTGLTAGINFSSLGGADVNGDNKLYKPRDSSRVRVVKCKTTAPGPEETREAN